jgi:chromosome segregation ATPase
MINLIIALIVSLLVIGGVFVYILRSLTASVGNEKEALVQSLQDLDEELATFAKHTKSFASRGQFDTLIGMLEKAQSDLESEKNELKTIESKLDVAQKDVEQKEFQQQELKSAKEEDELKLNQLLESYETVSSESINLEQQLAQSLKNLDTILAELEITDEQRDAFEQLSEGLTIGGSLLRELITEYNSVNERLNVLREQHDDLEEEYTRLVEQQLGE